jgi:8-oxo-dGTP pyrophosphatase MutT (NUDIX family)
MKDWKLLQETVLHKGFRRLIGRRYQLQNGTEHLFEIIENPDSVAVFAITKTNQVVLAQQFRPGPMKQLRELPGGIVDAGEDPVSAAMRELKEETGFTGDPIYLGSSWYSAYACGKRHMVLATNCIPGERELETTEDIEVVLASIDSIRDQALTGEMTDAATAIRALAYLGKLEPGR